MASRGALLNFRVVNLGLRIQLSSVVPTCSQSYPAKLKYVEKETTANDSQLIIYK